MTTDQPAGNDVQIHGGDTGAAESRFGRPAEGWLDLSTGVAPFSYPTGGIADAAWRRLPEPRELAALAAAAAAAYRVPDPALVVAAPGSQAILQRLPGLRTAPSHIAVVSPTYGEHARTWAAAGHAIAEVATLDEGSEADVLIMVNPNNPDGRRIDPALIAELVPTFARRGGLVVVDEAFAEVAPELSAARLVGAPGLVVLRSFGKFFGLAGLRLGFALAPGNMAERLRASLGPWPVAGPAIAIATRALADSDWIAAQRTRLADAARRLRGVLTEAGFEIVGGTDLFVLAARRDAEAGFEHLARAGILVRRFPAYPTWLRFGLPGAEGEWHRLAAALDAFATTPRIFAARG